MESDSVCSHVSAYKIGRPQSESRIWVWSQAESEDTKPNLIISIAISEENCDAQMQPTVRLHARVRLIGRLIIFKGILILMINTMIIIITIIIRSRFMIINILCDVLWRENTLVIRIAQMSCLQLGTRNKKPEQIIGEWALKSKLPTKSMN